MVKHLGTYNDSQVQICRHSSTKSWDDQASAKLSKPQIVRQMAAVRLPHLFLIGGSFLMTFHVADYPRQRPAISCPLAKLCQPSRGAILDCSHFYLVFIPSSSPPSNHDGTVAFSFNSPLWFVCHLTRQLFIFDPFTYLTPVCHCSAHKRCTHIVGPTLWVPHSPQALLHTIINLNLPA